MSVLQGCSGRDTRELRRSVPGICDIVPSDFTYKTQSQRQNYEEIKMVITEN